MHNSFNRRTATKVRNGRVLRKDRHALTALQRFILDRESPGRGFRHVLSKRDVQAFIEMIPDFGELSERLERIVLASPDDEQDGGYAFYQRERTGAIFLNAWPEDLWTELTLDYFEAHEWILSRLGVAHERTGKGVQCRFTEPQARAFMLLHVFMHELGHHHDRLNQKNRDATRGEDYAERFATVRFEQLWPEYVRVFGNPKYE